MSALLHALREQRRAAAAIEFAIVAPVFLMLIFAGIELAFLFSAQHALQLGVATAARYAALHSATATPASVIAQFDATIAPVLGTCPSCLVTVLPAAGYVVGGPVTVTAIYPWTPFSPIDDFTPMLLGSTLTLTVVN